VTSNISRSVSGRTSPLYGGEKTPRVAIIGAGLGGVSQGVKLIESGITTFTIFEKSSGPGGTWWDNRYPGAACDVPSLLYSYDFMLEPWKKTHATQSEIQEYIERVIDRFGFRDRFVFGTGVTTATWNDDLHVYTVETTTGQSHEFDVVVSAVGMLNVPNEAKWPGLEAFEGDAFHSSRWPADLDLTGKRVAVVGAGASATQIVPALAEKVSHLVSFQREPSWVTPKNDHDFSAAELNHLSSLKQRKIERKKILKTIDTGLKVGSNIDGAKARAARAAATAYIADVYKDRPDLKELMTPDYPLRCKRAVQSNTFLQAFTRDNVELRPHSVQSVTPTGIIDDNGAEFTVDAIVLATGFQTTNYLATLEVFGRNGRSLHEAWNGEPEAFLGLTVPGFPNFYLLYGPNTHGTVVSFVLERQSEFVAKDVARLARHRATAIEVKPGIARWFQRRLVSGISTVSAWTADCHSYYHSASGRNVTQWPWSHARYARWIRFLRVPSSTLSRRSPQVRRPPSSATTAQPVGAGRSESSLSSPH
jgi:cation diffusion facilitator CzcD-associated flavoprotein CzcO